MIKNYFTSIFLVLSLSVCEEIQFIFFNIDGRPIVDGKNKVSIEYRIKNGNNDDVNFKPMSHVENFWGSSEKDNFIHNGQEEQFSLYEIDYKFKKQLLENYDSGKRMIIEFKVTVGSNKVYFGSQVLACNFFLKCYDRSDFFTKNDKIKLSDRIEKTYFKNIGNEVVKGDLSKRGTDHLLFKVALKSPKLKIRGSVNFIHSSPTSKVYFELDKKGNEELDIIGSKEYDPQSGSEYKIEIVADPNYLKSVVNSQYKLLIYSEDFYSDFIWIDTEKLLRGEEQYQDISLKSKFPFRAHKYEGDDKGGKLEYNEECMEWLCKDDPTTAEDEAKTHIWIPVDSSCHPECGDRQRHQFINNERWGCVDDSEAINQDEKKNKEKEKNKIEEKERKRRQVVSLCVEKFSNLLKTKIPFNAAIEKMITQRCEKRVDNMDLDSFDLDSFSSEMIEFDSDFEDKGRYDYLNFITAIYAKDCSDSKSLIDEINEGLCHQSVDSNGNKWLTNEEIKEYYYFLIDLADILYKDLRKKYNDQKLLDAINGEDFIEIERLRLLYGIIDLLHDANQGNMSDLAANHYPRPVPSFIKQSIIHDHYLQRIEFYYWLIDSLFYIEQLGDTGVKKIKKFKKYRKFDYLCIENNPISKTATSDYTKKKYTKQLYKEARSAISYYVKPTAKAVDRENYDPKLDYVENIKKHMDAIINNF